MLSLGISDIISIVYEHGTVLTHSQHRDEEIEIEPSQLSDRISFGDSSRLPELSRTEIEIEIEIVLMFKG